MEIKRRFKVVSVREFDDGLKHVELEGVPWEDVPYAGPPTNDEGEPLRPDTDEEKEYNTLVAELYEKGPRFLRGGTTFITKKGGFRPGQHIEVSFRVVAPLEKPETAVLENS